MGDIDHDCHIRCPVLHRIGYYVLVIHLFFILPSTEIAKSTLNKHVSLWSVVTIEMCDACCYVTYPMNSVMTCEQLIESPPFHIQLVYIGVW